MFLSSSQLFPDQDHRFVLLPIQRNVQARLEDLLIDWLERKAFFLRFVVMIFFDYLSYSNKIVQRWKLLIYLWISIETRKHWMKFRWIRFYRENSGIDLSTDHYDCLQQDLTMDWYDQPILGKFHCTHSKSNERCSNSSTKIHISIKQNYKYENLFVKILMNYDK